MTSELLPKLLPCPFCGGKPTMIQFRDIVCNNKNCTVHPLCVQLVEEGKDLNNSIEAWNTRPTPKTLDERKRLKNIKQ